MQRHGVIDWIRHSWFVRKPTSPAPSHEFDVSTGVWMQVNPFRSKYRWKILDAAWRTRSNEPNEPMSARRCRYFRKYSGGYVRFTINGYTPPSDLHSPEDENQLTHHTHTRNTRYSQVKRTDHLKIVCHQFNVSPSPELQFSRSDHRCPEAHRWHLFAPLFRQHDLYVSMGRTVVHVAKVGRLHASGVPHPSLQSNSTRRQQLDQSRTKLRHVTTILALILTDSPANDVVSSRIFLGAYSTCWLQNRTSRNFCPPNRRKSMFSSAKVGSVFRAPLPLFNCHRHIVSSDIYDARIHTSTRLL